MSNVMYIKSCVTFLKWKCLSVTNIGSLKFSRKTIPDIKATISLKNRRFDEKSATKSTFVHTHREAQQSKVLELNLRVFLFCSNLVWCEYLDSCWRQALYFLSNLHIRWNSRACIQRANFSHVLRAHFANYKFICNLQNGALLTIWLKLFVQKSTLHRVVDTKSVKESEEMSYVLEQSSKSSFCKIQIFKFAYSALE